MKSPNLSLNCYCFRSVVESVKLLLDFIETLEEKLKSVHSWARTRDHLSQLVSNMSVKTKSCEVLLFFFSDVAPPPPPFSLYQDTPLTQLLAQVVELQTLSSQVLQWREVGSSLHSDSSV